MLSLHVPSIRTLAAVLALGAAGSAVASDSAGGRHLIYIPSATAQATAIGDAFMAQGFTVHALSLEPNDRTTQARTVARQVRALMADGVAAEDISVVGAGDFTALVSAATGSTQVNYVLLGGCDALLKSQYRFRMSGHVLGIRDSADSASHSCRALWQGAPRVTERRDLVVDTGLGAALFDSPQAAWMDPALNWASRGTVKIGEVKISQAERAPRGSDRGG
jgi:hypothetical protein